jgi:hypothetical protein
MTSVMAFFIPQAIVILKERALCATEGPLQSQSPAELSQGVLSSIRECPVSPTVSPICSPDVLDREGHGFSRAEKLRQTFRLQPLREPDRWPVAFFCAVFYES